MKNARYDEFQLATRHRIAFQTLILTMVLIGINGQIKTSYNWADPVEESLVLIFVPMLYFVSRVIWHNAYIRANESPIIIVFVGFVALFGLIVLSLSIVSGTFHLVEDGRLSNQIGIALMSISFTLIFTLLIIRKLIDRRMIGRD